MMTATALKIAEILIARAQSLLSRHAAALTHGAKSFTAIQLPQARGGTAQIIMKTGHAILITAPLAETQTTG